MVGWHHQLNGLKFEQTLGDGDELLYCYLVAKLCLTVCNPMNHSTPGFPVFHYLPECAQIHVH